MRCPEEKKPHKLTPGLVKIYHEAIVQSYEGKLFNEKRPCPVCGNGRVWRYNKQEKIFCRLITDEGIKDVKVKVKRFKCKKCGHVFLPKGFYSGCAYGVPVVDLCLLLASRTPYHKTERILANMLGVCVDGCTIKRYATRFEERVKKLASMKMFGNDVATNFLKLFFGVKNVKELKKKYDLKSVESVSDGLSAKKGVKKKREDGRGWRQ